MLYDGPTVDGVGEVHMFADIYSISRENANGALQGYGGTAGLNTLKGTIRYEDQENYNSSKGTLCHDGIDRHTIAIGPALQNPDFTLTEAGGTQGNIVEWYVRQGEDGKNKSTGLNQFSGNGGIIIYRDEVALEKHD